MRYEMSQAELIEAVQFYLNEKVLKRSVTVKAVKPRENSGAAYGINYALHVTVEVNHITSCPTLVGNDARRR